MTIRFTLPRVTKSLNIWQRMSWRARQREQRDWDWLVRAETAALTAQTHWEPRGRIAVSIERHGPRRLDTDNLWASVKPLVDALKHCGLIQDDTDTAIDLTVTQAHGIPSTVVTLASSQELTL